MSCSFGSMMPASLGWSCPRAEARSPRQKRTVTPVCRCINIRLGRLFIGQNGTAERSAKTPITARRPAGMRHFAYCAAIERRAIIEMRGHAKCILISILAERQSVNSSQQGHPFARQ